MRHVIAALLLCVVTSQVQARTPQLDDLMTPDEIAEEIGAPRTEATTINPDEIALKDGINIFREYALVIRVNKSAYGPGAQTMTVYEMGYPVATYLVSTGREQYERAKSGRWYWTTTPPGTFTPYSLIRNHYSNTWEAHMEYAAFFNGGIAIHATTPDHYKELGRRASGGCVRLHKDHAKIIYEKIQSQKRAMVPLFNNNGRVARDVNGNPIRVMGYNTLIIVEEQQFK